MAKSADAFRTISEVAEWLDTPAHVLRFWESRFSQVKPVKRAGGRRYYRPNDMLLLGGIKKLLHEDGMTIKGAQKLLRTDGIKKISAMSQPLDKDDQDVVDLEVVDAPAEITPEPAQELSLVKADETAPVPTPAPESESAAPNEPENAVEPAPEVETTPEPDVTAAPEPVVEATPETTLDAELVPEATPEPEVALAPEQEVTPETEVEPLITPEPEAEVTISPEPVAAPVGETTSEPASAPELEATTALEPEVATELEAQPEPEPEPAITPASEQAPVPEPTAIDIAAVEPEQPEETLPPMPETVEIASEPLAALQADAAAPSQDLDSVAEAAKTAQLSTIYSRLSALHDRMKADIDPKRQG